MIVRYAMGLACAAALAACSSTPIRYHTLVPLELATVTPLPSAPPLIELVSVTVSPEVDVPQIVTRSGDTAIVLHDSDRWSAPLSDEIHAALDDALLHQYGVQDLPPGGPADSVGARIGVRVERFDGVIGQHADLVVDWWVVPHGVGRARPLSCQSLIRKTAGPGLDDLIRADQMAIQELAKEIVEVVKASAAGMVPAACHS